MLKELYYLDRLFWRRGSGLLSETKRWHGVVLQMFCSVGISEGGVEKRLLI